AGAAAGLAAAEARGQAGPAKVYPKSGKLLRIGIIGGRFGLSFQWHEHPNCRVAAVCDILADRRQALQETYLCDKAYTDWRELVRDPGLDAVGVFTPAPLHVEMVVGALEAGKHVISAVPAGTNEQECVRLIETVRRTGRLYMMAETSYYRREIITAREMAAKGEFGEIIYSESEYHHDGLSPLWWEADGRPTWRHGYPPMWYPTHCIGMIVPVTGERLAEVTAVGWGEMDDLLAGNPYNNPFYSETAFFKTSGGHSARVAVYWKVASGGIERGQFFGTNMSFYMPLPGDVPARVARRSGGQVVQNRYAESEINTEPIEVGDHYDLLPEPLRHSSGHGGSHTHLTHEFVTACLEGRRPTVDVHEAVAFTVPGFYAHQSALEGGTLKKIPDYGRG
ncbi:MAG: Gfo/Idh/MocA family oxidoreductase, partial [Candidatus Glassbacteria bacterium]